MLIGFQQGTADGYATYGETVELGDIDGALVIQQPVSWTVKEEIITASETSDEERKTGFSRVKVYQGQARKTLVEKRLIEQQPLVEEYMSEEIVEERRHKPKRTVQRKVVTNVQVSESEESVEEVV